MALPPPQIFNPNAPKGNPADEFNRKPEPGSPPFYPGTYPIDPFNPSAGGDVKPFPTNITPIDPWFAKFGGMGGANALMAGRAKRARMNAGQNIFTGNPYNPGFKPYIPQESSIPGTNPTPFIPKEPSIPRTSPIPFIPNEPSIPGINPTPFIPPGVTGMPEGPRAFIPPGITGRPEGLNALQLTPELQQLIQQLRQGGYNSLYGEGGVV